MKIDIKLVGLLGLGGFLFQSIMSTDLITKNPYNHSCYSCMLLYMGACATALGGTICFGMGLIGKQAGVKPTTDAIIVKYYRTQKSQDGALFYIINTIKSSLPDFQQAIQKKQSFLKKGLISMAISMILLLVKKILELYINL